MNDFNVDVKLTDELDPKTVLFINMTIGSVPTGAQQLTGEWRGDFFGSSGGEFIWDGRPAAPGALIFDGPSTGSSARVVGGLNTFVDSKGGLPARGTKGGGAALDTGNQSFNGDGFLWEVT